MRVPYVDLAAQYRAHKSELDLAVARVLESGFYIGGPEVDEFENSFKKICDTRFVTSVANGTDALIIAMKALGLGPGDEVITAPNSWISSASTIALIGATPVFADVAPDQNIDPEKVEAAITPRTKAIMPVHLTGKPARMDEINAMARQHKLYVIEDAAQAVGARYKGQLCGSLGDVACFSLHPLKNLNSCGDAGAIVTNDPELHQRLSLLGRHGMPDRNTVDCWGYNSRLDALQAAIVNVRMKYLESVLERRRQNAALYRELLQGVVATPKEHLGDTDGYHLFVIQVDRRDELKDFLEQSGVGSAIHYPIPIHLQPAAKELGYAQGDLPTVEAQAARILSLPISEIISSNEVTFVAEKIKQFFG